MTNLFGGHRFQVFLSSTFKDLIPERQQVIQTLQRLSCFPVAMEHFPASYEEQWQYIKPLIEQSDYFICIIAGKYGYCDDSGKSFTQREFEHAINCKIPTLVFYHEDVSQLPTAKTEKNEKMRRKLQAFVQLAKKDRLCEGWAVAEQLPALVMQSMLEMITTCPRPGWRHRGEKTKEFMALELENSHLLHSLADLQATSKNAPKACFVHYDDAVATVSAALKSTAVECARAGEVMKIRILGICLHKSMPTLFHFIDSTALDLRLEIRLAILDEKCDVFGLLDPRWPPLYDVFHHDLEQLLGRLRSGRLTRNISVKLAKYSHMPNWHGLLVNYQHLFLGHCLWHEDGRFTAGQNPYDYYVAGDSPLHDRKIKQYVHWFDLCRRKDTRPKNEQLLLDTGHKKALL